MTVASFVKEIVDGNAIMKESLILGIASHAKLAELIKPQIEKKIDKKINVHTIIMALRRYENELIIVKNAHNKNFYYEIQVKTDISYLLLLDSDESYLNIKNFINVINKNKKYISYILHDNEEISIITNNLPMEQLLEQIDSKEIISLYVNMALINLKYTDEFDNYPEILHKTIWQIAKNNIQITKLIINKNELILIINEKDVMKTYNALFKLKKSIFFTPIKHKKHDINIRPSEEK